jgi:hypothetical protein
LVEGRREGLGDGGELAGHGGLDEVHADGKVSRVESAAVLGIGEAPVVGVLVETLEK